MWDELRELAYPETTRSTYEGVPVLGSRGERDAFSKDTDHHMWKQSKKYTDMLFNKEGRR